MRSLPIFVFCLLAACAPRPDYPPPPFPERETPFPEREEPPERVEPEAAEPERLPRTTEEASGPAVLALLAQADDQAGAGELDRAAAMVERALDVEPRNPFVYHRLAALRLAQDQPGQAEALARKSNSLAGDNPHLQARNWALIAEARYMRGDRLGADTASARADYYRYSSGRLPE